MTHTEYRNLTYDWKLFQGDEQVATGGFETKARMEFESQEAFQAGDAPVKVDHKSAYMKSRKQASVQLSVLRPNIIGNWGAWRAEQNEGQRSAPLLVDGKEAFRLYLQLK